MKNIKSQISIVFHLDKCIGCHTCSIACKNVWTDRKGAEYMWWNNVETKPGTGYPHKWEDQDAYKGGWEKKGDSVRLKGAGKAKGLKTLFHNTHLPTMDNYYEPWTYQYSKLLDAPEGDDQPTAEPISMITGEKITPKAGPNWDDDLGGSPEYARNDVNMKDLSPAEQETMFQLERMVMFYVPRICNHCLNPACVAACPSGAIYKRGEDGIVLVNQEVCRGWRMCVTACPYKKVYFNWHTGKSEKCILCYPRIETDQAPACMHSCVGRIRYLGVMLYDADRLEEMASCNEKDLQKKQLDIYLDPNDPEVIREAKECGIADSSIQAAQKSPVYKYVKEWGIALPLHPEFRTLPSLFYVPPLLPAMAQKNENDHYHTASSYLWEDMDNSRLPLQYLASLFSAGNTGTIRNVLKKLMSVRMHRRAVTVGDLDRNEVDKALLESGLTAEVADDIYRLTSLAKLRDRFVIPPAHREEAIEMLEETHERKGNTGFGFTKKPNRGL
ncbi:respiratory nitrate reductase beta subunit [Saccharicrinis carchari]|uniref:Respiratory nitrate reductase beta subunit n=1 Tax=Saccharicrinis carchari TaxID=1168039 RepID=A0A521C7D4_SACCC|nr:nitrate reductase subunit beta [Saccharicrinis carchari]SMO54620.1 respiratory nitrate reductase beta subunit [Saccharicrinis carchari]